MGMREGFVVSREWTLEDIASEIWEFEQGWGMSSSVALARYQEHPSEFPIQFKFWINLYRAWLDVTAREDVVLAGRGDSHGALWAKTPQPIAL